MPANYVDSPSSDRGDTTLAHAGILDFSVVQPFVSPSKNPAEDLRNRMRGLRAGTQRPASMRTPRARNPLVDRRNPSEPAQHEFTPLLKSAKRNELVRRSLLEEKENSLTQDTPETPIGFRSSYGGDATQLPVSSSMLDGDNTESFAVGKEATPIPPTATSSMLSSTPMPELSKRGEGGVLDQGNILTLRDQEAKLDHITKDNFGLKLKIHFLEEALRKTGSEFHQATLKENAELKTERMTIDADLKRQRKRLQVAENELEEYRQKYVEYTQSIKKRHAEERNSEELERLQKLAQQAQKLADKRQQEIEDMRRKLDEAQQADQDIEVVQALKDDVEDLQREIRDRDNQLDAQDEIIGDLKAQLETAHDGGPQVEHMQQDIDDMEAELKEKEKELEARSAKIAELEERVNTGYDREKSTKKLRSDLSDLESQLREKCEALDEADDRYRNLQKRLQDAECTSKAEIRRRDEDLHELQKKLDALEDGQSQVLRHREDSLRNAQRELADKDGEIRALQERLQTARGSWDAEAHQTDARLQEKDIVIQEKEAKLREKSATIEQRDNELDDLQKRLRSAENRRNDTDQRQADRISALSNQVEELEEHARISDAASKAKQREKDGLIKAREEELSTLQSRISAFKGNESADLRAKVQRIQDLEDNEDLLERQIRDQAKRISSLELQLNAMETPSKKDTLIKAHAEQIRSLEKRLQKLVQEKDVELDGLEQELDGVEKENAELKNHVAKCAQLESQLADELSHRSDMQRKIERLNERARTADKDHSILGHQSDDLSDKQKQIETLEDELDELQGRLKRVEARGQSELQKLRVELQGENDAEKQALEDELVVLETGLDEAEMERRALRNRCEALEEELVRERRSKDNGTPARERNELRLKMRNSEAERESLKTELQQAESRASNLHARIANLEDELQFAREEKTLAEERQDLHDLLKKSKIEAEDVQVKLSERDKKLHAASMREEELRGQLEAVHLESEDLNARLAEYEAKIRAQATREKDLRVQLKEFREARIRLEELEMQIGDRNSSSSGHARREAEMRTQLRDAKIGLESLQIELAEKEDRIVALMKREHALRGRLRDARTGREDTAQLDQDELQAQLDDAEMEVQTMQRQLQEREKRIVASQRKEIDLRAKIKGLQHSIDHGEELNQKHHPREIETIQKRHQRELRGLAKQIQFLRSKCEREEGFKKDLIYTKNWFLMQIDMFNECNQADLKLLEGMGITPDRSFREAKHSLRTVGIAVVAMVRMQKMSAAWANSKKVQESLVKKLEGVHKAKVRSNGER